jgi:hypothetical protein
MATAGQQPGAMSVTEASRAAGPVAHDCCWWTNTRSSSSHGPALALALGGMLLASGGVSGVAAGQVPAGSLLLPWPCSKCACWQGFLPTTKQNLGTLGTLGRTTECSIVGRLSADASVNDPLVGPSGRCLANYEPGAAETGTVRGREDRLLLARRHHTCAKLNGNFGEPALLRQLSNLN